MVTRPHRAAPTGDEVDAEQGDVPADEDLGPADPVGQPSQRDGQSQVGDVRADVQQREVAGGEIVAPLQGQVEEAVADGQQAEQAGREQRPAQAWTGRRRAASGAARPARPRPGSGGSARRARGPRPRPRRTRTRPRRSSCSCPAPGPAARRRPAGRSRRRWCPGSGAPRTSGPAPRGSAASAISASRGAVRSPLPSRSAVITAVIAANPCTGSSASRLTAEMP